MKFHGDKFRTTVENEPNRFSCLLTLWPSAKVMATGRRIEWQWSMMPQTVASKKEFSLRDLVMSNITASQPNMHHFTDSYVIHLDLKDKETSTGVALTRKNCVFYAKKEQATQIWKCRAFTVRKKVTSYIKMRLVFLFFAPSREGL